MLTTALYMWIFKEGVKTLTEANIVNVFEVFLSKFLVSVAIHLYVYPNFLVGLDIMKYVNNHSSKFDAPLTSYLLGLFFLIQSFFYEFSIVFILFSRTDVYLTLGAYLSVMVLVQL